MLRLFTIATLAAFILFAGASPVDYLAAFVAAAAIADLIHTIIKESPPWPKAKD